MPTLTRVQSKATDKAYALIQMRVVEQVDGIAALHVQGRGPNGNRDYGFAVNVAVSRELAEWLKQQPHTLPSLAGTGKRYAAAQARYDEDLLCVRFQVPGKPYNRGYGAAFRIDEQDSNVAPLRDWLIANDITGDPMEDHEEEENEGEDY